MQYLVKFLHEVCEVVEELAGNWGDHGDLFTNIPEHSEKHKNVCPNAEVLRQVPGTILGLTLRA
jgi:hypothetical protein